ncbi:MAG TPA: NCS2 family permease [Candidatus Angelobacter sp.]
MSAPRSFFQVQERGTSVAREVVAGLTTFTTMAYIVVVNPAILSAAGIPKGPAFTATVLAAVFGCLLMGLYANRPFAIAPYMGENAFIVYTVCLQLGYKWQTALAAIFIAGVLFVLMTVVRLRQWVVDAVPLSLRYSFAAGIGLFLTFIGLNQTGIVALGVAGAPVRAGHLTTTPVLVAVAGFVLLAVLVIRNVPGAILLGILITAAIAYIAGVSHPPSQLMSLPPNIRPILWQLDLRGALSWRAFPIVLTIFIMAFVDTMGTLIGLSARAGFLDEEGNLPQVERPMLVDALSTCFSPAIGTTTSGTFVESAAGIEAGGRTGLTAIVTAACFALSLFFAPLFTAVPAQAYGPALILVGLFMLEPVTRIDFRDTTESIPAFAVVTLMCFTFNIAVGITAGLVLYPLCKVVSGRSAQIKPGMWALGATSLLFFAFYPYG